MTAHDNTSATPCAGRQDLEAARAVESVRESRGQLRQAATFLRRAAERAGQAADQYALAGNATEEAFWRSRAQKLDRAADEALAALRPW